MFCIKIVRFNKLNYLTVIPVKFKFHIHNGNLRSTITVSSIRNRLHMVKNMHILINVMEKN